MKITYTKCGDYFLPNLVLANDTKNVTLGKYARMRLNYLKSHKKAEYTILFMNDELTNHLLDIDKQASDFFDAQMKLMAEKEGITEELKAINQLEWVGKMNNLKNSIEEIILERYIYN